MLKSRRLILTIGALVCALTCLTGAGAALAGGEPASVSVSVEGLSSTLIESTHVTTQTAPLVKDGSSEHACSGTSALAALELASAGNWAGPWNSEFRQYEILTIAGETHLFEPKAAANYYWSYWLDEHEATQGACESELHQGDRVLFFPACFGEACPAAEFPLGIEAPASANVGEALAVTVRRYTATGQASPAAGAVLSGADAAVSTDTSGSASVRFSAPGTYTLRASAPASVRSESTVCVHAGNDGRCGTPAPASSPSAAPSPPHVASAPYRGAFAVVAQAAGVLDGHVYPAGRAPRVLAGTVLAHAPVTSVSLALRRSRRGRCFAYDGAVERFVRARCGSARPFEVATGASFSYLLPSALPAGRYVLDVRATDVLGNRTALARGVSRIVFYVR